MTGKERRNGLDVYRRRTESDVCESEIVSRSKYNVDGVGPSMEVKCLLKQVGGVSGSSDRVATM